MKLSAPKQITWFVALALAVLALLGQTSVVAALSPYSFWLALIAAALMLLATMVLKVYNSYPITGLFTSMTWNETAPKL